MKTKHTVGPWKNQGNLIFSYDHRHVAKLFQLPRGVGQSSALEEGANARLIAAAPDMLDALKKIASCLAPEDNDIAARAVRAAITKAEGER